MNPRWLQVLAVGLRHIYCHNLLVEVYYHSHFVGFVRTKLVEQAAAGHKDCHYFGHMDFQRPGYSDLRLDRKDLLDYNLHRRLIRNLRSSMPETQR